MHLNGGTVGASAMASGFTAYDKRVLYQTYDVTDRVRAGQNVLGAELGRGWYGLTDPNEWYFDQAPWHGEPALKAQLEVTFADGSRQTIASDASWRTVSGPTRNDSVHRGERYDARLLPTGWDKPGFAGKGWTAARQVEGPKGLLQAANVEPIAPVEQLAPVSLTQVKPGVWVYDFGRIFSGWTTLDVRGPRGTTVSLVASERIGDDGMVVPASGLIDAQLQTDRYTLAGSGAERWEPSFGYRGFRYVELRGYSGTPTLATLTGKVAHSAVARTGNFTSANPLLNEIDQAAIRTILNNMHGYQTDTPTYEKNGWTGDAQASAGAAARSLGIARVWTKWLNDYPDAQAPSGELPEIVPATPFYGYEGTPGWSFVWGPSTPWDVAAMILPWELYQAEGDTRILARMHAMQKRLVDYTATVFKAPDYRHDRGLSEWSAPGPLDIFATNNGGIDAALARIAGLGPRISAAPTTHATGTRRTAGTARSTTRARPRDRPSRRTSCRSPSAWCRRARRRRSPIRSPPTSRPGACAPGCSARATCSRSSATTAMPTSPIASPPAPRSRAGASG